jgi:hypothetical protein
MTAREDLAKLIYTTDNSNAPDPDAEWRRAQRHSTILGRVDAEYAYQIADGLIAAGYRKSKTLSPGDLQIAAFGLTADQIIMRLIEDCDVSFKEEASA